MAALHLARTGHGPRLVLVHGSIQAGWEAWDAQRALADRFELLVLWRSGYAPNPDVDEIDFQLQADEVAALLQPGDHLVGHSYGGVVALLAATRVAPMLGSLTLIEPPAFGMAAEDPEVRAFEDGIRAAMHAEDQPTAFFRAFCLGMGASPDDLPTDLPPLLEGRVRSFMKERWAGDAVVDLEPLVAAGLPTLVVSGDWHPAFDAVCDVLERELSADRVVLPGAGHSIPDLGDPFNDALATFVGTVERAASTPPAEAPPAEWAPA